MKISHRGLVIGGQKIVVSKKFPAACRLAGKQPPIDGERSLAR
jgi:hypothetical protein